MGNKSFKVLFPRELPRETHFNTKIISQTISMIKGLAGPKKQSFSDISAIERNGHNND